MQLVVLIVSVSAMPKMVLSLNNPIRLPFIILFCSCVLIGCTGSSSTVIAPGEAAPKFNADLFSGGSASLNQLLEGKLTVLHFWASWCTPCMKELPELEKLSKDLPGLKIVSIAVEDQPAPLKRVIDRFKLSFPVVLDPSGPYTEAL